MGILQYKHIHNWSSHPQPHITDPHSFKISRWMGSLRAWVCDEMSYSFTSHRLQIQLHCTWPHTAFFNTISIRSDWPLYEVAASESGSPLIWLLQWKCYRLFAWLWPRDQLLVNMKTFQFWKILLAQAERAYSWLPITRTFKGNWKRFELSGARRK